MLRMMNRFRGSARRRGAAGGTGGDGTADGAAAPPRHRRRRRSRPRVHRATTLEFDVTRPEPHRPQVPDRLSVATCMAARHECRTPAGAALRVRSAQGRGRDRRQRQRPDPRRSSRTTTTIDSARPGPDLRIDPRRHRRRADDRTALGGSVLKDNRLLPRGFDKTTADAQIGVFGDARADETFSGGSDSVRYRLRLPAGRRWARVEVEILYQPIGYRWAHNLDGYDANETTRFKQFFRATEGNTATVVASSLLLN